MGLAQLFDRMLLAEAGGACHGLGARLKHQLAANPDSRWPGDSGWLGRLVQHIRQLRGGGTSIYTACALSEVPALSRQLLKSALFETMDDALFVSAPTAAVTTTIAAAAAAAAAASHPSTCAGDMMNIRCCRSTIASAALRDESCMTRRIPHHR